MPTERVDLANSRGQTLAALLELPEREPVATALFAHCFTCGKDNLAARRIAEALAQPRPARMSIATSASGGEAENICSP